MPKYNLQKSSFRKSIALLMLIPIMLTSFACGNAADAGNGAGSAADVGNGTDAAADSGAVSVEGDLQDIIAEIYAGLEGVDSETKEAIEGYISDILTEENEQALLGTSGIDYIEGIYSVPLMSSIAYQCVLLRVNPDDVENIKQQLKDNADLNKWVCVSAETMLVENVGDLVLFIMSEKDVAYAVSASFQALAK